MNDSPSLPASLEVYRAEILKSRHIMGPSKLCTKSTLLRPHNQNIKAAEIEPKELKSVLRASVVKYFGGFPTN